MLDFLVISVNQAKRNVTEIRPKFKIGEFKDLMIRGSDFYAIWDEKEGMWSKDENTAVKLIDEELRKKTDELSSRDFEGMIYSPKYMWDSDSGSIDRWHKYVQRQMRDQYKELDSKITFKNTEVSKEDFVSKRLPYSLEPGSIENYDKLVSVLYSPEERAKFEWAIGSIIAGDSRRIQKFLVFYGSAGSGKSTILNIVEKLFEGYCGKFDAKALGSANNQFAMESLKSNPLVAIQHDGDLSRIEDNTRLNSIVSHERMEMNEKFKSAYDIQFNSFLFMGTNKPVKITEAKSGLLRRLIDVRPTGVKVPFNEYIDLTKKIEFELGAIAYHCLEVYQEMGEAYYEKYIPKDMMSATNDFYDFVESYYDEFKKSEFVTLKDVWGMYKTYCDYAKVVYPYPMRAVRVELKNYFDDYKEQYVVGDKHYRNVYIGFKTEKFYYEKTDRTNEKSVVKDWLAFNETHSIFDVDCSDCFAQYGNAEEKPVMKWDDVTTKLKDLDTTKLHYVMIPNNHIVVDLDIKDADGNKSLALNMEAANKFPKTYAEISKGGQAIHLHYIYQGDTSQLSRIYDTDIEVKVFTGNSSLRRKLTKCNDIPIATINSGLPLKGGKNVVNFDGVKNEKAIRTLITNNLNKEYAPATKPSVDFIFNTLEEAYNSGMEYDVRDMRPAVLKFAANSTNQSSYCLSKVSKMHFCSETVNEGDATKDSEAPIVFFDVEVFPNLFVVCWKQRGEEQVHKLINPTATDITQLTNYRLVGFNNRKYDNHILYARILGYDNEQLFELSNKIIKNSRNGSFGNAYNMSYTDVYDFAAKKQGLKKWEIELGIHHQELGLRWDEPVPEDMWDTVAEYCSNDVIATEAVFEKLQGDFLAREILSDLSGLSMNDTTNANTTRIIFGKEKHPQLNYVDLSETFPGYEFVDGKNMYRGTDVGRGGYIISNPGIYSDVALLDVASLHPNSILNMNLFGEYTQRFRELVEARIAIKHGDYETARNMLDGKLAPYLEDKSKAKELSYALKIAINSVYGLTAASFDNPFRDIRNKNNIVALRGALFMKTLQDEVESRGYKIVAIKTDSIKIANATKQILEFCFDFAKKYGYTFEHEATYDRICQINDADYVARYPEESWCQMIYGYVPEEVQGHEKTWTVTGKRFAHPYIFKYLFSKEQIVFEDMCETKSVTTAMYLDMNEGLPEGEHNLSFVGKVGQFCPIAPGKGGGILFREKDGKYDAVAGTKGYRWLESETIKTLGKEKDIDKTYFKNLVDDAVTEIEKYGSYDFFVSEQLYDEQYPF